MPRKFVNEFKDGDVVDGVFLVADKQLRANRNAALYLSVDLRDKTGSINARMWNVTENSVSHFQIGEYVRAKGKVQVFQSSLQIIATHFDTVDAGNVDPEDFTQQTSADVERMKAELLALLRTVEAQPLKTLLELFFADEPLMAEFCQTPAGVKAHHAYQGGLLEHVLTLANLADKVSQVYPNLSRDLLLCGVFLHDIGKTRELTSDAGFAYTDEGQLLGHLNIGVEMLSAKLAIYEAQSHEPFPEELIYRLKHLILSHHGSYEFGSPRLPMTPEAITLHLIDNLDAKVHEFSRAIADDPNSDSHWTLFNPRLDRKIFKGAKLA